MVFLFFFKFFPGIAGPAPSVVHERRTLIADGAKTGTRQAQD